VKQARENSARYRQQILDWEKKAVSKGHPELVRRLVIKKLSPTTAPRKRKAVKRKAVKRKAKPASRRKPAAAAKPKTRVKDAATQTSAAKKSTAARKKKAEE